MDDIVAKKKRPTVRLEPARQRPTRSAAEAAVRTLIAWAGDDPQREGLKDTPRRVTEAFEEYFSGYRLDPTDVLARQFDETGGYDDLVMLRDIRVESHCEHHLAPFLGVAHVAYLPNGRIVGISKIARVVEIFAKRLQTQETMTAQIANAIEAALRRAGSPCSSRPSISACQRAACASRGSRPSPPASRALSRPTPVTAIGSCKWCTPPARKPERPVFRRCAHGRSAITAFAPRGSTGEVEQGRQFQPKFDADGLIAGDCQRCAIRGSLDVCLDECEALALTLATGFGHFWSRSRRRCGRRERKAAIA